MAVLLEQSLHVTEHDAVVVDHEDRRPLAAGRAGCRRRARRGDCERLAVDQGRGDVELTSVGAGVEDGCGLFGGADASANGEGDKEVGGGALDGVEQRAAAFVGGGDVEEDDLVGTGGGAVSCSSI